MTLRQFLISAVQRRETVPFVPNMDTDNLPEFPEGYILPITEEVYMWLLEVLPPRWMSGAQFIFAEGTNRFCLLWQGTDGYYGLQLSEEETKRFCELSGAGRN